MIKDLQGNNNSAAKTVVQQRYMLCTPKAKLPTTSATADTLIQETLISYLSEALYWTVLEYGPMKRRGRWRSRI